MHRVILVDVPTQFRSHRRNQQQSRLFFFILKPFTFYGQKRNQHTMNRFSLCYYVSCCGIGFDLPGLARTESWYCGSGEGKKSSGRQINPKKTQHFEIEHTHFKIRIVIT